MNKISRKRPKPLLPPKRTVPIVPSSVATTEASTSKAIAPNTSTETVKSTTTDQNQHDAAKTKQLLENEYARELFFHHTNITQVVAKLHPGRSEGTRKYAAEKLYEKYVLEPKHRIRNQLHEVRFDTRCHQGLFQMALKMPITSTRELTVYKQKLASVGCKKLVFVDMTKNNVAFQHQEKIIQTLKQEFRNWSAKLEKIRTYITNYHRKYELGDRVFHYMLMHHSSLKDSYILQRPHIVKQLVEEWRLPSERRIAYLWKDLRFDKDALERKYLTGKYSRFQNGMDCEADEEIADSPPPSLTVVQEETAAEDCEMQMMAAEVPTSSAAQANINPSESPIETQILCSPEKNCPTTAIPISSMLITSEAWEREIQLSSKTSATPSPKPTSVPRASEAKDQPLRTVTNLPKSKHWKKDPILRAPCRVQAGCIPYDSDTTIVELAEQENATDETGAANNQSIVFVSIEEENFDKNCNEQPAMLRIQSVPEVQHQKSAPSSPEEGPLTDSAPFTPFVTSTQNQSQTHSVTQDPLQLTALSSTIPPFGAVVPCPSDPTPTNEPMRRNISIQTQSQTSSTIPPFQVVNSAPNEQLPNSAAAEASLASDHIKQESLSEAQSLTESSGYEGYVDILPCLDSVCYTIEDDSSSAVFNDSLDPMHAKVDELLTRMVDSSVKQAGQTNQYHSVETSTREDEHHP
uniref:Uncharacterized protein n=1 Tax=Anopheles minimus TaxID=112268 RepID=A0A182WP55_9DIPT